MPLISLQSFPRQQYFILKSSLQQTFNFNHSCWFHFNHSHNNNISFWNHPCNKHLTSIIPADSTSIIPTTTIFHFEIIPATNIWLQSSQLTPPISFQSFPQQTNLIFPSFLHQTYLISIIPDDACYPFLFNHPVWSPHHTPSMSTLAWMPRSIHLHLLLRETHENINTETEMSSWRNFHH